MLTLNPPFIISSRLLPAVQIGNVTISLDLHDDRTSRRTIGRWFIDGLSEEYGGDDFRSGVGGAGLEEMMVSFLDFLSAAGEAWDYQESSGRKSDNADLFPPEVCDWAYQNDSDILYKREEIRPVE